MKPTVLIKVLIIAILSTIFAFPKEIHAYDFGYTYQGQTLYYNIVDGTAHVTYDRFELYCNTYTNLNEAVVIPDSVNNGDNFYVVTSIDENAFYYCTGITSIIIPNSVTSIGERAFVGCSQLASVTIPNTVSSIGDDAFGGCTALTSITIPDSVTTIGYKAFSGCSGLTNIFIPDNVISIGDYAFNRIRHIEYHGNATGSPWGAFSINGVTDGDFVYSDTTKHHLTAYIGEGGDITTVPFTVDTIGYGAFYGCGGLSTITIPNGVTVIGEQAFLGCRNLTNIDFPESVTVIGNSAFASCIGLTSIVIPDSVAVIGNSAFSGCSNITSLVIGRSVDSIGVGALGCQNLASVTFNADSCLFVGNTYGQVFYNNITSFTFGDNVKVIPDYLCYRLNGLTSITIPRHVTTIGERAFAYCTGLTSVNFNADSCTLIKEQEYYASSVFQDDTNIVSFTFGNNVKTIPAYLCMGFSRLSSIIIPDSVTSIGDKAFYNCSGITSLTLPEGVISIGDWAFANCNGLSNIVLPNTVTTIGYAAFSGCQGMSSITIGRGVTSIDGSAFGYCSGLISVVFNADSCTYANGTYPIFINDTNITTFSFGDNVKAIPDRLCQGLKKINTVTIPHNVTYISHGAFSNCISLTSVIFNADSCTYCNSPFYDDTNISSFIFGENVKIIPDYLCSGCSGLESINIPNSVKAIGRGAFYDCTGLTNIIIGSGVTTIGASSFLNCKKLTTISIPNNVTSIGAGAFSGCSGLTSVTIPNNVTTIGGSAFYGCTGLKHINIGNGITDIGDNAFNKCLSLDSITIHAEIAPTLQSSNYFVFHNNDYSRYYVVPFPRDVIINIPCGSYSSYASTWNFADTSYLIAYDTAVAGTTSYSSWSDYGPQMVREPFLPTRLTVLPNDTIRGETFVGYNGSWFISSDLPYPANCNDSTAVITASPKNGYHFSHWSNGSTANPDTVILKNDSTLTAYFVPNTYILHTNVNDSSIGSVSFPNGDTALYLDTIMIVAQPISHYHVDYWSGDGIVATSIDKDTAWVIMDSDHNVTCTFAIDRHTLNVGFNDLEIPSMLMFPMGVTANYGDTLMAIVRLMPHYHIFGWIGNGIVVTSITLDTIWVAMTENRYLICNVAIDTHTVSVMVNDTIRGHVTVNGEEFEYGDSCIVEAIPYTGYQFLRWSNGSTDNPYIFTVLEDVELTATFLASDETTHIVSVSSNDTSMGVATVNGNSTDIVMNDEIVILSATANPGFRFVRWSDNDTNAERYATIISDTLFTAYFEALNCITRANSSEITIAVDYGNILIVGALEKDVNVYDMMGRRIETKSGNGEQYIFVVPSSGVYLVKVEGLPARRVVVVK